MKRSLLIAGLAVAMAYALTPAMPIALAQPAPGMLDAVIGRFNQVRAVEAGLLRVATDLFLSLALISTVFAVWRALRGGSDMIEILAVLVERAVVVGFFWFMLVNGGEIARAIVSSFAQAANDASVATGGSANMSPTDTFGIGINLAKTMWEALSVLDPGKSFLLVIGGFLSLGALVFCAALQIEALIESKFISAATVLFLGFSGSEWTRDIAIALIRACIAIGAKLLFLQMLIGGTEMLTRDLARTVRSGVNLDMTVFAVMVGVPIVLAYLCKTLPSRVQSILNGAYIGGPGLGHHTAGMAKAAAAAAIGAAGIAAAGTAAYREASSQITAREQAAATQGGGGQQSSGLGRAGQIASATAQNFGKALANDVGQRLSGNYSANHGSSGFRMAQAITAKATQAKRNSAT